MSSRLWRFVDLGRRLDFLLAGFGWCRMPEHLVAGPIAAGHRCRSSSTTIRLQPEG
ncbi:hypothetical protein ACN28S_07830 [Cystobacter fuscus]